MPRIKYRHFPSNITQIEMKSNLFYYYSNQILESYSFPYCQAFFLINPKTEKTPIFKNPKPIIYEITTLPIIHFSTYS